MSLHLDPSRIRREKNFHDSLAQHNTRAMVNRLASSFYDKLWLWRPVWKKISELNGRLILDYGCGAGGFSFEIASRGARVVGIDISEGLLRIASQETNHTLLDAPSFLLADAHRLPFRDESFDFVFGNGILHHLDVLAAYHEIARVLKPHGLAIFVEPLNGHPIVNLFRKLTPRARTSDEQPFTFEMINAGRNVFQTVVHEEEYLFSILAAPLNLLSPSMGRAITRCLASLDRALFRLLPAVRRYAWMSRIELHK